jgi:hypothetical protein
MTRLALRFALQTAGVVLLLSWLKHGMPASWGIWTHLLLVACGFAFQFLSFQQLWAEQEGEAAARALCRGQLGWILLALGLSLEGPAAGLGALNLCLQQFLLTLPLAGLLKARSKGDVALFALLGLALAGCLPFSAFPAYFQSFSPLMGVGQNVADMKEKLFTSQALVGTLVIFSLMLQTAALGSCLLRRLRQAPQAVPAPVSRWAWACLAMSLVLGLGAGKVAGALSNFYTALTLPIS